MLLTLNQQFSVDVHTYPRLLTLILDLATGGGTDIWTDYTTNTTLDTTDTTLDTTDTTLDTTDSMEFVNIPNGNLPFHHRPFHYSLFTIGLFIIQYGQL